MLKSEIKIKKLSRKCLVCGKTLEIKLYPDRTYRGAEYFGKMKIAVGKGEHKKTGEFRIGKKKYDVVKWTGKEKDVEYWECEKCYKEASNEVWLEEIIEKLYGKKCKEYEKGCPCCDAWSIYDDIIDHIRGRERKSDIMKFAGMFKDNKKDWDRVEKEIYKIRKTAKMRDFQ